MTGRGRTRASAQPEPAASTTTSRRGATRQASAPASGVAMPPPSVRPTRSTRAQSKEVESSGVPVAAMQDIEPTPESQVRSEQELYTQPEEDEEDNAEDGDEHFEDAVEASQEPVAASQATGLGQELVPSTQYQQSEGTQRYERASTVMRSDIMSTPAGTQAVARLIKRFLPKLFDAADVVTNHLYVQSDYDTWNIEYSEYEEDFTHIRDRHFSSDNGFIDQSVVLQKADAANGNPAEAIDASEVVAAANIATLVCDLYHHRTENHPDNYILEQLWRWDHAFPTTFLPSSMPHGHQWTDSERDFAIALDLRTQIMVYTIKALLEQEDADFMETVTIWFHGVGTDDPRLVDVLKGQDDGTLPFRDIAGLSLMLPQNSHYRKLCVERLGAVTVVLNTEDDVTNRLKEMFNIEELLGPKGSLQNWCDHMFATIKDSRHARSSRSVSGAGNFLAGSVAPSQILGQDDSQEVDPSIYSQPPTQDPANDHAQNVQNVRMLYGQIAPPPAQQQRYLPQTQSSTYSQNGSSYPPPPLAGPAEFSLGTGPLRSPAPSQSAGALYATSAASGAVQLGKRPRTSTQDDGDFEMGATQAVTPRPRKKRQRIQRPEPDLTPDNQMALRADQDVDLVELSQRARRETMIARKPREPQSRTPWSRLDTKKLIQAVDKYKCKWSMIEAAIVNGTLKFDTPRNQQALRDKARLLKQDMLKTDIILPPSFDYVVLGKKERQAVIACRRNPDRKEADVNEDGTPTNTVYPGDNNPDDVAPGENEAQRDHGQEVAQGNPSLNED